MTARSSCLGDLAVTAKVQVMPVICGRVSVVMACFNAAQYVADAVGSVLSQSYPDVELIVVDDGSTDNSRAVLAGFRSRIKVINQNNQGPYPARNCGLAAATGQFIAFLDADDWWAPDFLRSMIIALQASRADVAYCGWQNIGVSGPRGEPYVPLDYCAGDPVEHFLKNCPWPIHAALIRRSVLDQLNGFSERMFSSMDYDLWIRMLAVTRNMVRLPLVLAYYRWHGSGQISATKWRQVLNAWQVRRDFVAAHPTLVAHLSAARLKELVDGVLLQAGYEAFWRRDLEGAQPLFRKALRTGAWQMKDLKYLAASLLPSGTFRALASLADTRGTA